MCANSAYFGASFFYMVHKLLIFIATLLRALKWFKFERAKMSSTEYQAFKDVLHSRIVKLEELVRVVESYKLLLEEKTKGYVAAIVAQKAPFAHTWFYIVRWFRTFVGIKDEAMLLINGELVRKYHKQQHEIYMHTRGNEEKYYKIAGLLGLSGCCCDGLNYDLRRVSKQYKEFAVRFSDGYTLLH
jgi:hypothetical protein